MESERCLEGAMGKDHVAISTNVSSRPGMDQLRRAAAMLFVEGVDLDLEPIGLAQHTGPSGWTMQLKLGVPLIQLSVPPLELASVSGPSGLISRRPQSSPATSQEEKRRVIAPDQLADLRKRMQEKMRGAKSKAG